MYVWRSVDAQCCQATMRPDPHVRVHQLHRQSLRQLLAAPEVLRAQLAVQLLTRLVDGLLHLLPRTPDAVRVL